MRIICELHAIHMCKLDADYMRVTCDSHVNFRRLEIYPLGA